MLVDSNGREASTELNGISGNCGYLKVTSDTVCEGAAYLLISKEQCAPVRILKLYDTCALFHLKKDFKPYTKRKYTRFLIDMPLIVATCTGNRRHVTAHDLSFEGFSFVTGDKCFNVGEEVEIESIGHMKVLWIDEYLGRVGGAFTNITAKRTVVSLLESCET
jgi:hypothetical protein